MNTENEQSGSLHQPGRPPGRRMIMVSEDEAHQIRYALTELAGRRAEQSIDRRDASLGVEANNLRALADSLMSESRRPTGGFSYEQKKD